MKPELSGLPWQRLWSSAALNITVVIILTHLFVAAVLAGLSIPLILRRVGMNKSYGMRFEVSFKSEKNWYDINEFGGKALLISALPIAGYGLLGLFLLQSNPMWYAWVGSIFILAAVLGATWVSYHQALKIDQRNHPDRS